MDSFEILMQILWFCLSLFLIPTLHEQCLCIDALFLVFGHLFFLIPTYLDNVCGVDADFVVLLVFVLDSDFT